MSACEGCGETLGPVEAGLWRVCLPCTKARHRAVMARGCRCGAKCNPTYVGNAVRSWWSCERCLGPVPDARAEVIFARAQARAGRARRAVVRRAVRESGRRAVEVSR